LAEVRNAVRARFPGDSLRCIMKMFVALSATFLAFCAMCGCKKAVQRFDIRDIWGVPEFLRMINYDTFDAFSLTIVVEKANYNDSVSTAIKITCGSNSVTTASSDRTNNGVQETVHLDVQQGCSQMRIEIIDTGRKGGHVLAFKKLSMDDIILMSDSAEQQTITLKAKTKMSSVDPRVNMTFCAMTLDSEDDCRDVLDDVDENKLSPEMQMLLMQASRKKRKSNDDGEVHTSSDEDEKRSKLELISDACKGRVKVSDMLGRQSEKYCAVVQLGKDGCPTRFSPNSKASLVAWNLSWWATENDCLNNNLPLGKVSMLRVTNVYVLPDKPEDFCIRYVNKKKEKEELYLRKSDQKSREVWVESLHLFIEQLRASRKESEVRADSGEKKKKSKKASSSKKAWKGTENSDSDDDEVT